MRKFITTGIIMLALLSLMTAGPAQTAKAAGLGIRLMGGIWRINANGFEGALNIASVDAQGNLQGTIFGQQILGFWDEIPQKITFMRVATPGQPATYQVYIGYLIVNTISPTRHKYALTGYFETFNGAAGGTATRSVFGWFAQQQDFASL